ncbi:MAG TPA: anti-sigma factor, partial [Thermoanaerobaculia bacterium]|nr:anti-sigma factor [Thermoanaerobaculia bacterium]
MAHNEHFEELAALQALGIPLGGEAAEFARHLEGCAQCEALLNELRSASTALAAGGQVRPAAPHPAVREAILRAVAAESSSPVAPPSKSRYGAWIFAIAATVMLAFFIGDDARLRREREELRSRTADLTSRLDSAQQNLARRDLQARVLESEDVRVLFLGGKDPQPGARAKVFWSQKAGRGVVVAGNLSPLPPGKQYELWVFSNGKPVPAGVFDADPSGRAIFESSDLSAITSAENFAVTVEPTGGVPAPT